ncbi:MAG: hypothetical protein K2Y22_04285 [Candidatus Obscuribacterales bacterium]|nr:hypothetical protein [Candidatus Obscuribacterales bacterium]
MTKEESSVLINAKGYSQVVYRCRKCAVFFDKFPHECKQGPDMLGRKLIAQMDMQKFKKKQRRKK